MTRWQIFTYPVDIRTRGGLLGYGDNLPDPGIIWTRKDNNTGKTAWDSLQEYAADGWELVSVTPVEEETVGTVIMLYSFKRPIEEVVNG